MTTSRPKPNDPDQSKRFIELAKELGADGPDADLQAAIKQLGKHAPEPRRQVGKKAKAKPR